MSPSLADIEELEEGSGSDAPDGGSEVPILALASQASAPAKGAPGGSAEVAQRPGASGIASERAPKQLVHGPQGEKRASAAESESAKNSTDSASKRLRQDATRRSEKSSL